MSVFRQVGNITIGCISPEARALLEKIHRMGDFKQARDDIRGVSVRVLARALERFDIVAGEDSISRNKRT